MQRTHLFPASVLLLGAMLLLAGSQYQGYLEMCVCIVNALGRGLLALGISILFGAVLMLLELRSSAVVTLTRSIVVLQVVSFLVAIGFFIHYAYLLLEIVQ